MAFFEQHPGDELQRRSREAGTFGGGAGRLPAASFQEKYEELRRLKLAFVAADAQLRFVESSRSCDGAMCGVNGSFAEAQRREARARNKALKAELARERKRHEALRGQLADAHRVSAEGHAASEREAQELSRLAEVDASEVHDPAALTTALGVSAANGAAGAEAEEVCRRAAAALVETSVGKLRQQQRLEEEEAQRLAAERRRCQDQTAKYERLEEQERAHVHQLAAFAAKEVELGFPRVEIDESAEKVLLVGRDCPRPELGALRVQLDAETGRLLRAEPHPSLGLWDEGTLSVERDDLGRLATLVWDRLHAPLREKGMAAAGGGA